MSKSNFKLPGFTPGDEIKTPDSVVMNVEGNPKCGKTRFALTAPGPIAYFDFDSGLSGVIHEFAAEKEIHVMKPDFEKPVLEDVKDRKDAAKINNDTGPFIAAWKPFHKAYYACLEHPDIRSIVIDTGTDMHDLLKLKLFGRVVQIISRDYTFPNAIYRKMVRDAVDSDKHVLFLHKLKDEYKGEKKTGHQVLSGFKHLPYEVEMSVRLQRNPRKEGVEQFEAIIQECRFDPTINGDLLEWDEISFEMVAGLAGVGV